MTKQTKKLLNLLLIIGLMISGTCRVWADPVKICKTDGTFLITDRGVKFIISFNLGYPEDSLHIQKLLAREMFNVDAESMDDAVTKYLERFGKVKKVDDKNNFTGFRALEFKLITMSSSDNIIFHFLRHWNFIKKHSMTYERSSQKHYMFDMKHKETYFIYNKNNKTLTVTNGTSNKTQTPRRTVKVKEVLPEGMVKAKEVIAEEMPKDGEKPLDIAEVMPSFPGGAKELMIWLAKNVHYPAIAEENGVEGKVLVRFAVGKDGSIYDVKVFESVDPSLDKEAMRVVKSMPKWIPGKQDGKPVAVYYTLPVTFHLQ